MPPSYADIGKVTKDLLSGNPKSGAFCYDPTLRFASSSSCGVSFAVSAVQKGEKIDPSLKIGYSTKGYSADVSVSSASKIGLNVGLSGMAIQGLKLSSSVTLPDPSSAKLVIDYGVCPAAVKAIISLTAAPVVDLTLSTGVHGVTAGTECAYDTGKSVVTKYNFGIGYKSADFQVAAFLADKCSTARLCYAHTVNPTSVVGAEVVRKLASSETTFTLGYQKKLADGALTKVKIDSAGLLSAMYETKLVSGEKVAGSVQVLATDLSRPLKYGFAVDLF